MTTSQKRFSPSNCACAYGGAVLTLDSSVMIASYHQSPASCAPWSMEGRVDNLDWSDEQRARHHATARLGANRRRHAPGRADPTRATGGPWVFLPCNRVQANAHRRTTCLRLDSSPDV